MTSSRHIQRRSLAGLPPLRQTKRTTTAGRTLPPFAGARRDLAPRRHQRRAGRLAGLPSVEQDQGRRLKRPTGRAETAEKTTPTYDFRMPPPLYLQPTATAAHDLRALDRAIATLLLRLDLVTIAVASDQPGPISSPTLGGPVGDERAGYHQVVYQQPNPAAAPTSPPRILLVDDIPAMRLAVRACSRTPACRSLAKRPTGCRPSPWPRSSSPTSS